MHLKADVKRGQEEQWEYKKKPFEPRAKLLLTGDGFHSVCLILASLRRFAAFGGSDLRRKCIWDDIRHVFPTPFSAEIGVSVAKRERAEGYMSRRIN